MRVRLLLLRLGTAGDNASSPQLRSHGGYSEDTRIGLGITADTRAGARGPRSLLVTGSRRPSRRPVAPWVGGCCMTCVSVAIPPAVPDSRTGGILGREKWTGAFVPEAPWVASAARRLTRWPES